MLNRRRLEENFKTVKRGLQEDSRTIFKWLVGDLKKTKKTLNEFETNSKRIFKELKNNFIILRGLEVYLKERIRRRFEENLRII